MQFFLLLSNLYLLFVLFFHRYVEQFDSLMPKDTARDAIEFSAAMRLPASISTEERGLWVHSVLFMLELLPIENTMVGSELKGGMSFEQVSK